MSEANKQVPKKELPEQFSSPSGANGKLENVYAHENGHIELLLRHNKDLRETNMWRAKEMERQAYEIWKLKLLLSEAGYDPENLPQPKKLGVRGQVGHTLPPSEASTSCPQNGETSAKPLSPFKYNDPTPKRKRTEHDDEEYSPTPKRRALPSAESPEANAYACEETYIQYSANHQPEHDIQDEIDEDEGESEEEEEEYLAANNPPASQHLETAAGGEDEEDEAPAEYEDEEGDYDDEDEAPQRSAADEQYLQDMEIAMKRSLEDMAQKEREDEEGEDQEDSDYESEKDEAPRKGAVDKWYLRDLETAVKRSLEDMAQKQGKYEDGEDQEDSDYQREEDEGPFWYDDEEDDLDDEDEAPEYEPSKLMDQDETEGQSISESSGREPGSCHNEGEDENEDASSLSTKNSPDLQRAIPLPSQITHDKEKEERGNAPESKSAKHTGGYCNGEKAPASSSSGEEEDAETAGPPSRKWSPDPQHINALLQAFSQDNQGEEHYNDGGKEVKTRSPCSKQKYSELEQATPTSPEGLRGEDGEKEAEHPAFRISRHPSEDYSVEEAPVPKPFERHSDNEEGVESQDSDSQGE